MSEKQHSCLVAVNHAEIPLEGVRIDARLAGLCSEVKVTQRYTNTESVDVEAVYVFPLEEGSAVCGFEAKVGDRAIRGRVEEREKAFEVYDDAMAAGNGAFLLDQERPNVFTASVGNLRPKDTVEITITYVALLSYEGPSVRLMIPTTISPRYVPAGPPQVGEPDGDRVNPPRADAVPYGLTLTVEVASDTKITQIDSPSHPVRSTLHDKGATVTLSSDRVALDSDFVLLVRSEDAHVPAARVAKEDDGTLVAMVTFYPDASGMPNPGNEVLFLLDCSGSMQGESIDQAKRALALCLRALGEKDTFNVVRFGSTSVSLWPAPRSYDQTSLDEATRYLGGISADLGGTEILDPLKRLLGMPVDAARSRQVLLLTDGQVSNEADVIELCKQHSGTARVFAFGIGAGASEHLVRSVSRVTRGAAEFIFPGERIEPKVLRMFNRVNTPSVKSLSVDWLGLDVEQAPKECPPVFAGDALTVFARVKSGSGQRVLLHADERVWDVPLDLAAAESGGPVPTLWARNTIRDLEAGHGAPARGSNQQRRSKEDRTTTRLVELGQRYGLMSSATSYVAVEERAEKDKSKGQAELRKVPIQITKGWHGRQVIAALSAAMPASPAQAMTMGGAGMSANVVHGGPTLGRMSKAISTFSKLMGPASSPAAYLQAPPPPRPAQEAFMDHDMMEFSVQEPEADEAVESARPSRGRREAPKKKAARPDAKSTMAGAAATLDRVFELLMTQRADGSFFLSNELRSWLGTRAAKVEAAARRDGEALVVTAVVLELLRLEAADRSDEWKPAAAKAERWLANQGKVIEVAELLKA